MNDIRTVWHEEQQFLKATQAIMVYSSGDGRFNNQPSFLSIHSVKDNGLDLEIGEGRPAALPEIKSILCNLLPEEKFGFFMPKGLLYLGQDTVAWEVDPQVRPAFISDRGSNSRVLKVPYPKMVFIAKGSKLFCFSSPKKESLEPEDFLFWCPAMNVFENAQLCIGSIEPPKGKGISVIEPWTKAFFESGFTHPNVGQEKQINFKGMVKMWDSLDGETTFCDSYLKSTGLTLQMAVKSIEFKGAIK